MLCRIENTTFVAGVLVAAGLSVDAFVVDFVAKFLDHDVGVDDPSQAALGPTHM